METLVNLLSVQRLRLWPMPNLLISVTELELWSRLMNANNELSKAAMNLVSGWFNNIGYYLKKKITIDY